MKKKRTAEYLGKALLWAVILLLAFGFFFYGLRNVREEISEQGRTKLEDAVRRAAVACYAAEGAYPPDIEYLKEHYGLTIDEDRYIVNYDIFAENLMPDITVLEIEP